MTDMMSYRIPDEKTLSAAIESVMNKTPHIETQKEFLEKVRTELAGIDREYRVSGERIRKVGIDNGLVKIAVEYRETDREGLPNLCPVCKNAMSSIMNASLDGDAVEIKRKCIVCPFTVGKKILVPGRYSFFRADNVHADIIDLKRRKLKKAVAHIKEASKLITDAADETELGIRADELVSDLKELISSEELSYSITNLILDLENDDPVWTRPMVSVKYQDRKDI